jgi:endonuclease/exonuclease/phosphatase family metal-dependent hydrolase
MRLRRLIPLTVICLVIFWSPSAFSSTLPLRVLSWNIQFGQGTDGVTNYDRIATWLARMNPDLIALCEVPPDKVPVLVSLLGQKTGRTWNSHFVPKAPGISEGNLILSRYGFKTVGSRYLSYTRSIAQATVDVGGRSINFFATHLDHTSSSLRLTQASEIINWTGGFAAPRVIAGDLNAGNDTPEIISLLNAYRDSWVDSLNLGSAFAYPDNPAWMNTRTRRWRIDFILYSADTTIFAARRSEIPDIRDLSNTNVVNALGTLDDKGVRPSDHNLVVSEFNVLAGTTAPVSSPVLLTQGSTDRAVAIHSTRFTPEPFTVRTPLNLSSDQRTRIILFASNVVLIPGENPSSVLVRATDSRGFSYELPVEQIRKVPNFDWLWAVIVRLPDDESISGDLSVTINMRGALSNNVKVRIK